MAGGATPDVKEQDRFYSTSKNGIPFVRVQNLDVSSDLVADELKFINIETHERKLKRSQVHENDLLVKITGVGRMAVSSIAPKEFEGNINQHIVVIKTKDRQTSDCLAFFLNSNIGEKLASRRSTGGTRPALDYPALRSIPIIFDPKIVEIMKKAHAEEKAKEAEAFDRISKIDELVWDALGIALPEPTENTLASRMFFTKSGEVSGGRTDPHAQHPERIKAIEAVSSSKYPVEPLHAAAKLVSVQTDSKPPNQPYLGLNSIQSKTGIYAPKMDEPEEFGTANIFKSGHVLFPKLRPYLNKVFYAGFDGVCSTEFHVLKGVKVSSEFLAIFLRTVVVVNQTKRLMTGNTLPRLQTSDIESLLIPIPPPEVQAEIVEKVNAIYAEAKQLRDEGAAILESAKAEVERMILGES